MTRINRTKATLALGLLAAAGLAAPAAAQDNSSSTSTSISISNGVVRGESTRVVDGVAYSIEFDGEGVKAAFIDGEPADFKVEGDTAILAHDGERIEVKIPEVGANTGGRALGLFPGERLRLGLGADEGPGFVWTQPRTMVGLSQTSLDEQLREHLGLEPGVGTLILSVTEGLPADKAGLREGDVLIAVSGREVTGAAVLTDALKDLEPGDELDVTVLRKGLPETMTIEVAAFDAEKLYAAAPPAPNAPRAPGQPRVLRFGDLEAEGFPFGNPFEMEFDFEALQDRIRGEIDDIQPLNPEQREQFDRAMDEAREQVERAMEQALRARELRFNPNWNADLLIRPGDRDRAVIIERDARRGGQGGDDRLGRQNAELKAEAESLRARNRELEQRLESLETRLDRLIELLEADDGAKPAD